MVHAPRHGPNLAALDRNGIGEDIMKIIKLVVTVIDFDGIGAESIRDTIQNSHYPNHCISPSVHSMEERDIGEWTDDHPLNRKSTVEAEIKRIFGNEDD